MRIVKKILIISFLLLIIFAALPYLISPIYKFPEVSEFKGDKIYNPYEGINPANWRKANFHAHSRMLWGLMDGRKNSDDKLLENYKKFGYDIIGISDYMYMNDKSAVPVYEHGYNISKNHYLILGDEKVNWFEMLFFQNIHNKQFSINRLKKENNVLVIAHPSMNSAFEPEDFRYLTNYDLMEILRYDRVMTEYLDSALSTGHITFLIADDDTHNIFSSREVGQSFTMVNCDSVLPNRIYASLKSGKSYGVRLIPEYFDFESKLNDLKEIPSINKILLDDNKILLNFSSPPKEIKFIGQNGAVRKIVKDSGSADYDFKPEDTYIRTEITYDKLKIYLNPFFRFDGEFKKASSEIDFWKTLIYRVFIITAISFTAIVIYKRNKKISG